MEIIPHVLENEDSVILQVRVENNDNGMNNFKKILKDLNLKIIDRQYSEKPWFYVSVSYK